MTQNDFCFGFELTSVLQCKASPPSCSEHSSFEVVGTGLEAGFAGFSCLLTCFDLGGWGIVSLGTGSNSGIVAGRLESCCSYMAGSFGLALGSSPAYFDTTGMEFPTSIGFVFDFVIVKSTGRRWGRKAPADPC